MLVTAWLSTATAAPLGADRQAPTKPPESHGLESQAPESQTLRLRFDNGLLSLHASQRSFAEVLGAIQKETGIRFHYTLPMAEAVTLSFDDLPVPDALKRLLGREAQLMFRFPERPSTASRAGVPEDVWIPSPRAARRTKGPSTRRSMRRSRMRMRGCARGPSKPS